MDIGCESNLLRIATPKPSIAGNWNRLDLTLYTKGPVIMANLLGIITLKFIDLQGSLSIWVTFCWGVIIFQGCLSVYYRIVCKNRIFLGV